MPTSTPIPVALARLHELEQRAPVPIVADGARHLPHAGPAAPSRSAAVSPSVLVDEPADPALSSDPVSSDLVPSDETGSGPRQWWGRPAALIAAVAVALIVVAASLATVGGGRPDRTLSSTPADAGISFPESYEWLTSALGIPRDSLTSFRGVGDLIVWAGTSNDGVSCLIVTSSGGPFGFGCSRDGRDATADVVLDPALGPIESTGLAERSTVRFTYRGDRVDVWVTEP